MFLVKSFFVVDTGFTTWTLSSEASKYESPGQKYVFYLFFMFCILRTQDGTILLWVCNEMQSPINWNDRFPGRIDGQNGITNSSHFSHFHSTQVRSRETNNSHVEHSSKLGITESQACRERNSFIFLFSTLFDETIQFRRAHFPNLTLQAEAMGIQMPFPKLLSLLGDKLLKCLLGGGLEITLRKRQNLIPKFSGQRS